MVPTVDLFAGPARRYAAVAVTALTLAGCSYAGPTGRPVFGALQPAAASPLVRAAVSTRCKAVDADFDELVACDRADGSLDSFANGGIGWRVRYFVRFWQMPCNEAPTVQEAYVFHMVTADLYADPDLDDAQRLAIRVAMFQGAVHCK